MIEQLLVQTGSLGIVAWVVYFTLSTMNKTIQENTKAFREVALAMREMKKKMTGCKFNIK